MSTLQAIDNVMHGDTCEHDAISTLHLLHKESQGNSSALDLDTYKEVTANCTACSLTLLYTQMNASMLMGCTYLPERT